MRLTRNFLEQIETVQGSGLDLNSLSITQDDDGQAYITDDSGDPVPPGTPPPVPPMDEDEDENEG